MMQKYHMQGSSEELKSMSGREEATKTELGRNGQII